MEVNTSHNYKTSTPTPSPLAPPLGISPLLDLSR